MAIKFIDEEPKEKKSKIRFLDDESNPVPLVPEMTPTGLPKAQPMPEPLTTLTQGSSTAPLISPQVKFGEVLEPSPQEMPIKQQISEVARPVLEMGGMMAGGALGLGASIPSLGLSAPITGTAGSIIGFATGRSAADLLDRALELKEPIQTPKEAIQETAESIRTGAFLEATGLGVGGAIAGTLKKVAGPVVVESKELMGKVIQSAKEIGLDLTPAEIAGTRGLSMLESLFDKMPWTANQIQRYRIEQLKKLVEKRNELIDMAGGAVELERVGLEIQKKVDDFFRGKTNLLNQNLELAKDSLLKKLGSQETNYEVGQTVKDIAQKKAEMFRMEKNQKYTEFKNIVPENASVVPSETNKVANELKQEIMAADPTLRDNALLSQIDAMSRGEPLTAPQLIANRTALSDLRSSPSVTNFITGETSPAGRTYSKLINAIDNDLESLAKATGNETIIDSFRIAKEANRDYKNYMKSPVFKRITRDNPEAVVNSIFNPGNETEIIQFKEMYGKEVFDKAKDKFTNSFLRLDSDEPISQEFIARQFNKYGETLRAIYTPQELAYVKRIGKMVYNQELATQEILTNPLLKGIVSRGKLPSSIIGTIVKPGDTTAINAIRHTIGEAGIKNVREGFTGDFLALNQEGNFMPQTFANNFRKYGRETLEALYPKQMVDEFERLALVGKRMGAAEKLAGNPSGTAQNLIGFFGGMAMMRHPVLGITAIVTSRNLSKYYLSPAGRKFFLEGITTPIMSKDSISLATKLFGTLVNEQIKKRE